MGNSEKNEHLEEDISIHIFTVSAAMVGVCLTVIGILHIVINSRQVTTFVDDLLSLDALLFLFSCMLSYFALRTRSGRRMHGMERTADTIFIAGLVLMVVVCGLIVYVLV
jgi:hypothetical protein